jgi:hypothetical protein
MTAKKKRKYHSVLRYVRSFPANLIRCRTFIDAKKVLLIEYYKDLDSTLNNYTIIL